MENRKSHNRQTLSQRSMPSTIGLDGETVFIKNGTQVWTSNPSRLLISARENSSYQLSTYAFREVPYYFDKYNLDQRSFSLGARVYNELDYGTMFIRQFASDRTLIPINGTNKLVQAKICEDMSEMVPFAQAEESGGLLLRQLHRLGDLIKDLNKQGVHLRSLSTSDFYYTAGGVAKFLENGQLFEREDLKEGVEMSEFDLGLRDVKVVSDFVIELINQTVSLEDIHPVVNQFLSFASGIKEGRPINAYVVTNLIEYYFSGDKQKQMIALGLMNYSNSLRENLGNEADRASTKKYVEDLFSLSVRDTDIDLFANVFLGHTYPNYRDDRQMMLNDILGQLISFEQSRAIQKMYGFDPDN